jgi:hypothetical protein
MKNTAYGVTRFAAVWLSAGKNVKTYSENLMVGDQSPLYAVAVSMVSFAKLEFAAPSYFICWD